MKCDEMTSCGIRRRRELALESTRLLCFRFSPGWPVAGAYSMLMTLRLRPLLIPESLAGSGGSGLADDLAYFDGDELGWPDDRYTDFAE